MTKIRIIEIDNFRSINKLLWTPSTGINCLIGPGDSGKSTILDAIDLCLGARRNVSFNDIDFHALDVSNPISISITIGDLPRELLDFDAYGDYIRGFDLNTGKLEDEPTSKSEPVLTIKLNIGSDLEPIWSLYSDRAQQQGLDRGLAWKDRIKVAPARIGNYAKSNLSWTRGSILNRLNDERPSLGEELASAARDARDSFGDQAGKHFKETLDTVTKTANHLGVPVGQAAQALLDAHSVSISDGAISLHNDMGVPLTSLGTGSSRLLVAGLQKVAAEAAPIVVIDEVEYGLEPHRLIRLLDSLGAKDSESPLQVFLTTHSPVPLRELSGDQLYIVREDNGIHKAVKAGTSDETQSTLRTDPEAFLSKSIIVCEGASEIGFSRGMDRFWADQGRASFSSLGGSYVNAGGGSPEKSFLRGLALLKLGYRVLVFVDADKPIQNEDIEAIENAGGQILTWRAGNALEDELFLSLNDQSIDLLLEMAVKLHGRQTVISHVISKSTNGRSLNEIETSRLVSGYRIDDRETLATASRTRNNGWIKSQTWYEEIAYEIVGPNISSSNKEFQETVREFREWLNGS